MRSAPHGRASVRSLFGSALLVGLVAGLGAWTFRELIAFVHNLAFGARDSLAYDANVHTSASPLGIAVVAARC